MPSSKPRWIQGPKHANDPDGFEESDARSLSKGQAGRTPGSGRLFPGDLDSVVDDFKTDNKIVGKNKDGTYNGRNGYRLDRDFWHQRLAKGRLSGHNFRESILFVWGEDGEEKQLHIVAVEGDVFESIYHHYGLFHELLEGKITLDEARETVTKPSESRPKWSS